MIIYFCICICCCGPSFVCLLCNVLFIVWEHLHLTQTWCLSNPLWVCLLCMSFFLSTVPPSWAPSQDIFPPECSAHVGSMSVSSRPSPHHHHTLDALWLPLQRAAWRHQWVLMVTKSSRVTSSCSLQGFVIYCSNLSFVAVTSCTSCTTSEQVVWTTVSHLVIRLCCGPDTGSEVCTGHCLWDGLLTYTWTHDTTSLSQQQECYGKEKL